MRDIARGRQYPGGTPFTNWIREQPGLESHGRVGYVGSDVDLVWYNYKLAMLMLLEEKQHMGDVRPSQEAVESILHQALRFALGHPDLTFYSLRKPIPTKITYCGYHLIQFENTGPEDGDIYIDGICVTKKELISFLQFAWTPTIQCYLTQQEQIQSARSLPILEDVALEIKRSVHSAHPEIALLRNLWREKMQDLSRMEVMFTSQDNNIYPYDDGMSEAERILCENDLEALKDSADRWKGRLS